MGKLFVDFVMNQKTTGQAKAAGLLAKMKSKLFASATT